MNNISAIVITKNEEKVIDDCLQSLSFVDEIIVIDSFSSDNTLSLVKKYNVKSIEHKFIDFSETRNFALKQIKTDWVLYIDADERVTPFLKKEILQAVNNKTYSAYRLRRKNYYLGKEWPYQEQITRLFAKKDLISWFGEVHESPKVNGLTGNIKGELLHYTHRNLSEMLTKTVEWSVIEAKLLYNNNHPSINRWRLIRVFLTGFLDSYINKKGFLAGIVGFIESYYQGFSMFITYVRLWELQNKKLHS